jgi:hypothetical protein
MQLYLPQLGSTTQTVVADTAASKGTIPLRDALGNIAFQEVLATELATSGNIVKAVVAVTSNFTPGAATDYECNATGGAIVGNFAALPASSNDGVEYFIWQTDSSGNSVTLSGVLGPSTVPGQYAGLRVISDGTNWYSSIVQGLNLQSFGQLIANVVPKTANFTFDGATHYPCNASGGAFTATASSAAANKGAVYVLFKTDSSGNAITISGVSGTTSLTTQYQKVTVVSDGTTWWSI